MGIQSDPHASYKLLGKAFVSLGYSVDEHLQNKCLVATFTSPTGKRWATRAAHLHYPMTHPLVEALSINKDEATKYVLAKGINTPVTLRVDKDAINEKAVISALALYDKIVVKPLDRSLSLGLTTDVKTLEKALESIGKAGRYSDNVLLQEQVYGDEIRFAVIDGKISSALMRRTPQVIGDGMSSLQELVDVENKKREEVTNTMVNYPQLGPSLIRRSLDMSSIPLDGQVVELSRATMISRGCSVYDVLERVDEGYLRIVEEIVSGLDTGFIVVDMFIADYTKTARDDNYWFIEFNTSPVLKLFYSCRDGNMHDIVPRLVDAIDKKLHKVKKTTLGGFEVVSIPEFGIRNTIAKVDTGAYSGAIGCSSIGVVKKQGIRYLRFSPGKRSKKIFETERFYERQVRSSTGHRQKRYLIETDITIRGQRCPITIGLSDRSDMKHLVLVGRRFLREQNLLVDVSLNQEYDTDREIK
jgi:D-alanine-D-alanine ligase-like ATP-grasp enzyme